MKAEEVEKIMQDITEDSNLCCIRNALENFEEEPQEQKQIKAYSLDTLTIGDVENKILNMFENGFERDDGFLLALN